MQSIDRADGAAKACISAEQGFEISLVRKTRQID